ETRFQRFAAVEIVGIARLPAERFALLALDTGEIDPACGELFEVVFRKIAADHTDDLHGVEHGARHREEYGSAAERVGGFAERRDDRIEGDRPDDEQAHATSVPGRESPKVRAHSPAPAAQHAR